MATVTSSQANNPHISALSSVFASSTQPIEWLVIAHNDAPMLEALSSAMATHAYAVWKVSEEDWEKRSDALAEAMEWALEQDCLKNVVLVGHSQYLGLAERAYYLSHGAESETATSDSHAKLIASRQRSNSQIERAKDRFAKHAEHMSHLPCIRDRCERKEITTYALFYRAEGGLFMAYDTTSGQYRPLVA